MEALVALVVLVLLLLVCACALAGGFIALVGCGYFLSIPMLLTCTGLIYASLVIWRWMIAHDARGLIQGRKNSGYRWRRRRTDTWRMTVVCVSLATLVVWAVAAFQTPLVQAWWCSVSNWMLRPTN